MSFAGLLIQRKGQLAALLGLLALLAAQLTGALLPNVPLFIAASAAGLALDLLLHHRYPHLLALLVRVRFDASTRQLMRDMILLLGLVRLPGFNPTGEWPLVTGLVCAYGAHFACQAVALLIRRNRALPVLTRNVDVSALHLSPAPPRILARQPGRRLLVFMVPATTGLLLSANTEQAVWGLVGVGTSLALFLGGTVWAATWLLRGRRAPGEEAVLEWLEQWLKQYQPTHALYFSGGASSAYQANMWLSTLAALDGRPLIVLRERFMVQKIEATDVPIVCIPKVAHLMTLEHSSLKVMIHPANSGKTSQVLRIPTIKHTFVNHGESDKLSSCNPYAKAYDEVWVAGPAARERYQLADIGVDDRDVVEVGRPQLAPVQPASGPPTGPWTTVLYAPTWEGWTDDPGNTSIMLAGENLVRALLADPGVRLLYKPHPMTGSVDPRAGQADQRIRALIAEANAARAAEPGRADPGARACAELARRTTELDRLAAVAFRASADDTERMLVQSRPQAGRAEAVAAAQEAWEAAFWASLPPWEHQVVVGPRPGIFSCFNQADLLISDVSSVVSDYLSSEKPYAVVNTSGLDEAHYRAAFPTVRAATVLTPDAAGLPEPLAAVRDPELDPLAGARAALKTQLLGPAEPPSLVRFNSAVQALCARADARRARMARSAAGQPGRAEQEEELKETTRARLGDAAPGDAEEPEDSLTA
ncbi:hypothetical protein JJV70_02935 [Streptomyces sp. JJ66]|nr:hypothetical protein [Streptomyces sp. JJ66]MBW1601073.1 hypothetical protein [Streptomyces sp. JJ66]